MGFVLGVCSGLAIPVAQRFGAGDYKKMRNYVANAAYVAIAMALVITVVTTGCCHVILRWMKTPESIFAQSYKNYETIVIDGKSTDNTLNIIEKYKKFSWHGGEMSRGIAEKGY